MPATHRCTRTLTLLPLFLAASALYFLLAGRGTRDERRVLLGTGGPDAQWDSPSHSHADSPADSPPPPHVHRRVVAVADLHGDLDHALSVLSMAGIIAPIASSHVDFEGGDPAQGHPQWVASHDVLVSTGDVVDRGDDTIPLYQLFDSLRAQAAARGGEVRNCLGNHEMMNALGDWRYVTPGDVASFGGEQQRAHVIGTHGWIGKTWMQHYNVSHTVDLLPRAHVDALRRAASTHPHPHPHPHPPLPASYRIPRANFVHGGIHPAWAHAEQQQHDARDADAALARINTLGHSLLAKALADPYPPTSHLPRTATNAERQLYSDTGPLWYRGYAYEEDDVACHLADEARRGLDVDYLVMGHTPHFDGFVTRCAGRGRKSESEPGRKPESELGTASPSPSPSPPSILLIDTGISRAYGGEQSALTLDVELRYSGSSRSWVETTRLVAHYRGRLPRVISHTQREVR